MRPPRSLRTLHLEIKGSQKHWGGGRGRGAGGERGGGGGEGRHFGSENPTPPTCKANTPPFPQPHHTTPRRPPLSRSHFRSLLLLRPTRRTCATLEVMEVFREAFPTHILPLLHQAEEGSLAPTSSREPRWRCLSKTWRLVGPLVPLKPDIIYIYIYIWVGGGSLEALPLFCLECVCVCVLCWQEPQDEVAPCPNFPQGLSEFASGPVFQETNTCPS